MHRFTLTLIFAILFVVANAQELRLKSFVADDNDLSARTNRVLDANKEPCALVKVGLVVNGTQFFGDVVSVVPVVSEYWVYLTEGATYIEIHAPGFLPLIHDFEQPLEKLRTYRMTLLSQSGHENTFRTSPQPHRAETVPMPNAAIVVGKTDAGIESSGAKENTFEVKGVTFNMRFVKGGKFTMGATREQSNDAQNDEKPVHSVVIDDFLIGETEVTQELWEAVMGDNPSYVKGKDMPVENVSWDDCQVFLEMINFLTSKQFRLPTEAQWEYAARGGGNSKRSKYAGGNNVWDAGWYEQNSHGTQPVAQRTPNELGIYDMSGNVWEWCQDFYGEYAKGTTYNPLGPTMGSYRVYRGGGWQSKPERCRVSARAHAKGDYKNPNLGLRLVCESGE